MKKKRWTNQDTQGFSAQFYGCLRLNWIPTSGWTPGMRSNFVETAMALRTTPGRLRAGSHWQLERTHTFLWSGWGLLMEEIEDHVASTTQTRRYTWGLDLAGSFTATGNVGNLLASDGGTTQGVYFYDANGNVGQIADTLTGDLIASYEYSPFGEVITSGGAYAETNRFRFSTKYQDSETGLLYYSYRYYDPETGRWLNRDPIEEQGGLNLYGFVGNDGVNWVDILGEEGFSAENDFRNPFTCTRTFVRREFSLPRSVLSIGRRLGIHTLKGKFHAEVRTCEGCCRSGGNRAESISVSAGGLIEGEFGTPSFGLGPLEVRIGWYGRIGSHGSVGGGYSGCSLEGLGGGCINLYGETGGIFSVSSSGRWLRGVEVGGRAGLNVTGTLCLRCDSSGCNLRARLCGSVRGRAWAKVRRWEFAREWQGNACTPWVDIL